LITSNADLFACLTGDDLARGVARHPISSLLNTVSILLSVGPLPFQKDARDLCQRIGSYPLA